MPIEKWELKENVEEWGKDMFALRLHIFPAALERLSLQTNCDATGRRGREGHVWPYSIVNRITLLPGNEKGGRWNISRKKRMQCAFLCLSSIVFMYQVSCYVMRKEKNSTCTCPRTKCFELGTNCTAYENKMSLFK
jgi:hypothetical protein